MSLAVGVATSSKGMGFDDGEEGNPVSETKHNPEPETEDEDDDETEAKIQLGPQCTLKELSEKDKVCSSTFPRIKIFTLFLFFLILRILPSIHSFCVVFSENLG